MKDNPKLIFTNKELKGTEFELKREFTTVGRAGDNLLAILDKSVSAHHCLIKTHGTEVIVEADASKNGTYVDEQLVKGQAPMHSGQVLRLGEVELRLEIPFSPEDDTDITTMLTYDKAMEQMNQQKARAKEGTTMIRAKVGDQRNEEDETIIFQKPKEQDPASASPASRYKEHEPRHHVPETRSPSAPWIIGSVVILVVVAVLVFLLIRA